jgi:hypothetical protein
MSTSSPPSAQPPPQNPQNKPRKKRSVDADSFEDLIAAHKTERGPGQLPAEGIVLIGVDLELQRRMAERMGLPALQDPAAAKPGAPNFGAPEISEHAHDSNLNIGSQNLGAPKIGAPEISARRSTKTYPVHSISRIEDVFTSAERSLLRWLWDKGRPAPATSRIRLVTGPHGEGARRLAAQAGLIYNTFKNLTRSLSNKFAIDIVKPEKNLPAVYAVYLHSAILERQRQAGFTGVVHKNGGARELVDAQARPAPRRADLTVKELEKIIGAPNFSAPKFVTDAP